MQYDYEWTEWSWFSSESNCFFNFFKWTIEPSFLVERKDIFKISSLINESNTSLIEPKSNRIRTITGRNIIMILIKDQVKINKCNMTVNELSGADFRLSQIVFVFFFIKKMNNRAKLSGWTKGNIQDPLVNKWVEHMLDQAESKPNSRWVKLFTISSHIFYAIISNFYSDLHDWESRVQIRFLNYTI